MIVIIKDETTGRDITLNLSLEQYERAQQDAEYVQELINAHDNLTDRQSQSVVVPDQTDPQMNSEETDENSQSNSLYIWSETCIALLLSLYEEKKEDFSHKRHKKLYNDIAKKMHETNEAYTMTGGQCQSKINSLKKTYKKILDHNATSGNDRVTWPYFDRMDMIFGRTGWANPVATASEAGPSDTASANIREKPTKRQLVTIFDDYFESKKKIMSERLAVKKESIKLKQEQHKEKMDMLKTICTLINNK